MIDWIDAKKKLPKVGEVVLAFNNPEKKPFITRLREDSYWVHIPFDDVIQDWESLSSFNCVTYWAHINAPESVSDNMPLTMDIMNKYEHLEAVGRWPLDAPEREGKDGKQV